MKQYLAALLTLLVIICVGISDARGLFSHQRSPEEDSREAISLQGDGAHNEGSWETSPGDPEETSPREEPAPGPAEGEGGDTPPGGEKKLVEDPTDLLVLVNKEYNLPSDYTPPDLVEPNITFSFSEDLPKRLLRREAAEALEALFGRAAADGVQLAAVSGYRSYDRQKVIFNHRAQERGFEVANRTSAYPGQSEHQTGLAMDVSGSSVGYGLVQSFGETAEGIWLAENAPDFGFIIRYPRGREGETGYSYEPWHLRYVGVEAAREISQRGLILEEYLLEMRAAAEETVAKETVAEEGEGPQAVEVDEREHGFAAEQTEDLGLNPSDKG